MRALLPWWLLVGCPNPEPPPEDSDGDTVLDVHEGQDDPDQDGVPNHKDDDSDGDGVPDVAEAGDDLLETLPIDTDLDRSPDFLDLDSDDDCMLDQEEAGQVDFDGDGAPDGWDVDDDQDGMADHVEMNGCEPVHTEDDGAPDHRDVDADDDGLPDRVERGTGASPHDHDRDGLADYRDLDSDQDGIADEDESENGGFRDTDGDGTPDHHDLDSDDDGLRDQVEVNQGSNPYDADTDGDGMRDGAETLVGTHPADPASVTPLTWFEVASRTEREEWFDLEVGPRRVDFLVHSSMVTVDPKYLPIVRGLLQELVEGLLSADLDSFAAVSQGNAFPLLPWGVEGGLPFEVIAPSTADLAALRASIGAMPGQNGIQATVTFEGVHQALTGAGYDHLCDGRWDSTGDVLPWNAHPGDPFAGRAGSLAPRGLEGSLPMGRRPWSLPVVVLVADVAGSNPDLDEGPLQGTAPWGKGPGGCPFDSGHQTVIDDLLALDGMFVGIMRYNDPARPYYGDYAMRWIAEAVGSLADLDGDGAADDPLVFRPRYGETAYLPPDLAPTAIEAVRVALESRTAAWARLEVEGAGAPLVASVSPTEVPMPGPDEDQRLSFTLNFRGVLPPERQDQVLPLDLVLTADGVQVDRRSVLLVVPGSGDN